MRPIAEHSVTPITYDASGLYAHTGLGVFWRKNPGSSIGSGADSISIELDLPVKQIRILIADDHDVMRKGLRQLLESEPQFTVVAEASDGRQAVEQAEATTPDVVVLDIAMPRLNGIEAAHRIMARLPNTSILMLSMHSDEEYVHRALKAGARGYLLKDSVESNLLEAITAVHDGKTFFSSEILEMLVAENARFS